MSAVAMTTIHDSGFEHIDHASYAPDLAPSHFHLFPNRKEHLAGAPFTTSGAIIADAEAAQLTPSLPPQPVQISGLNDAGTRLQTVYFLVL